ncbi:MOSC domain-containing protein [Pelagibacterium luteolum]|uniref:MOSC domain-containing protein YiiM n=1 Tax=Pelagibacterium luteolum TaxID=440168 RepID=A0A1G7UPP2_9HYPH|nr:MOSC domain-containing protein [Pelagibacterium luteolum]SDG49308.1 MOSC domain-containing protein YiiM [Pelagibacterium luteolum]
MRLVSVNIGQPRALDAAKPRKRTGICKQPITGPVGIHRIGVEGDAVLNAKHHGGAGQAVYLYTTDDYDWWAQQGVETGPGVFGENLTVSGMESAALCIGDRLEIGGVVLEVTSCRIPCATLAQRMGDPGFVKKFRDCGRPGAYLRVLGEGRLEAGQAVSLDAYAGDRLTLGEHFTISFQKTRSRETIERLLALPIAERDRDDNLKRLAAL